MEDIKIRKMKRPSEKLKALCHHLVKGPGTHHQKSVNGVEVELGSYICGIRAKWYISEDLAFALNRNGDGNGILKSSEKGE